MGRKTKFLKRLPRYLGELRQWRAQGGMVTKYHPMVGDYVSPAARIGGQYFHQDLVVAQLIHQDEPRDHHDVGSRIDGFVAHVAAFRKIHVIDIRPMPDLGYSNIEFQQQDIFSTTAEEMTDSLSCLHAVEHFGLGRYGDTLDVDGFDKAIDRMCAMVRPGGRFYVSFPIGMQNEVHFNAHRVMHPEHLLTLPSIKKAMNLERFDYVDDRGDLCADTSIHAAVGKVKYGCGIYTLRKAERNAY